MAGMDPGEHYSKSESHIPGAGPEPSALYRHERFCRIREEHGHGAALSSPIDAGQRQELGLHPEVRHHEQG